MHCTEQGVTMALSSLLGDLRVIATQGSLDVPVRGIAYHSAAAGPGSLFVAIAGTRHDGHAFVQEALSRGASAAVVERMDASLPAHFPQIQVSNGREALAMLSCAFHGHPSRHLTLVGVTGTNGKTTTVHILESILAEAGHRVGALGTIAYRFGGKVMPAPNTTPESLDLQRMLREMVDGGTTHAIMEVTSHALDQHRVLGCLFQGAAFTNLSRDHLDYHGEMPSYLRAKGRLFREHLLPESGGGWAVLNAQDPASQELARGCKGRVIWYGYGPETTLRAVRCSPGLDGTRMVIGHPGGEIDLFSPLLGQYTVLNTLTACACAWALGVAPGQWRSGLANLKSVPGRFEPVRNLRGIIVVVDYAHTPDALDRSLASARDLTQGRLICVFGCGGDRDRGKRPFMAQAAARHSDVMVVTSDNPRTEAPDAIITDIVAGFKALPVRPLSYPDLGGVGPVTGYVIIEDRAEAIRKAIQWARPGDVVVIAGKGHETYQILGSRTISFDDREVARRTLEEIGG